MLCDQLVHSFGGVTGPRADRSRERERVDDDVVEQRLDDLVQVVEVVVDRRRRSVPRGGDVSDPRGADALVRKTPPPTAGYRTRTTRRYRLSTRPHARRRVTSDFTPCPIAGGGDQVHVDVCRGELHSNPGTDQPENGSPASGSTATSCRAPAYCRYLWCRRPAAGDREEIRWEHHRDPSASRISAQGSRRAGHARPSTHRRGWPRREGRSIRSPTGDLRIVSGQPRASRRGATRRWADRRRRSVVVRRTGTAVLEQMGTIGSPRVTIDPVAGRGDSMPIPRSLRRPPAPSPLRSACCSHAAGERAARLHVRARGVGEHETIAREPSRRRCPSATPSA